MTISRIAFYFCLSSGLILALIGQGLTPSLWGLVIVLAAALWGWSGWKKIGWIGGAGYLFFLYMAARISARDGSFLLPILLVISVTLAWNINGFCLRLGIASHRINERRMVRHYFARLGLVIILSSIAVLFSTNLDISVSFIWIVVLALVAVIAIGRMGKLAIQRDD